MPTLVDEMLSKIIAFLNINEFQYFVHLKYLRLYRHVMQYHYVEANGAIGVLLRYPTHAVSWDASYYPQTETVLLPLASGPNAAQLLARYVRDTLPALHTPPTPTPLVIKFCEPNTKTAFEQYLNLEPAKTFISYSTTTKQPLDAGLDESAEAVIVSTTLDPKLMKLYQGNGYSQTELETHFTQGACSFTIYERGEPVSTCFVFRNFGSVWEIGGVHTVAQWRQKGYARKVVQQAVNTLLDQACTPRYQTDATNTPSVQLAESVGLTPYSRLEHYLALPRN